MLKKLVLALAVTGIVGVAACTSEAGDWGYRGHRGHYARGGGHFAHRGGRLYRHHHHHHAYPGSHRRVAQLYWQRYGHARHFAHRGNLYSFYGAVPAISFSVGW